LAFLSITIVCGLGPRICFVNMHERDAEQASYGWHLENAAAFATTRTRTEIAQWLTFT